MAANQLPFPVLAYILGLRRSAKRTFIFSIMNRYAASIAMGDPFGKLPYAGDDLVLMAGDYIADSSGKLEYIFNAQHAHDRPSVEEILSGFDAATA